MIRKNLLLFLFALLSILAQAQEERPLTPVEWSQIEKIAKTHPDSIKALVARLTRPELDTTLSMNERVLAFYGQTYISRGGEALDVMRMNDSLRAGSSGTLVMANKALAKNPLNLEALMGKASALFAKAKLNPSDSTELKSQARYCMRVAMRVYNTIASTGRGTADEPFSVTSVGDEYSFINYYLNVWKIKGQSLVNIGLDRMPCDIIHLGEKSEYWEEPDIYFDITRVLQLERQAFSK